MADRGTYIKMSDSLPEHRKIVAVGGDAAWLHVCALAYASRNLTDGFIPAAIVPRLSDRKQPAKLAARLADAELWHAAGHQCKRCPQPGPDTYVIHDYLIHQRSAERVAEVSASRATAGSKGGSKSRPRGKQNGSNLLDPGLPLAEANGNRSFAETEEPLRGSQAEAKTDVPPTAGAARRAARQRPPSGNAGDVIAAFVEGARSGGYERPSEDIRKRVGAQATRLISEGFPLERLVDSARRMGATSFNDLAVQLRKDDPAASKQTSGGGHSTYRNPTDQDAYENEELRPS